MGFTTHGHHPWQAIVKERGGELVSLPLPQILLLQCNLRAKCLEPQLQTPVVQLSQALNLDLPTWWRGCSSTSQIPLTLHIQGVPSWAHRIFWSWASIASPPDFPDKSIFTDTAIQTLFKSSPILRHNQQDSATPNIPWELGNHCGEAPLLNTTSALSFSSRVWTYGWLPPLIFTFLCFQISYNEHGLLFTTKRILKNI